MPASQNPWLTPTGEPVGQQPVPAADQALVEDARDQLDLVASPAAWLSSRTLLILTVATAVLLLATVVVALIFWSTPPMDALNVPKAPQV